MKVNYDGMFLRCLPVIINIENIERVEETQPGFLIKEKDSFKPRYFFPPHYDPVYVAVKGVIRNLRKSR